MFQLFEIRKNKKKLLQSQKERRKFLIKFFYKLNNNSYISSSFYCFFFVNFFNFRCIVELNKKWIQNILWKFSWLFRKKGENFLPNFKLLNRKLFLLLCSVKLLCWFYWKMHLFVNSLKNLVILKIYQRNKLFVENFNSTFKSALAIF